MRSAGSFVAAAALAVTILDGCGGNSTPRTPTAPSPVQSTGSVDPVLVGTWSGNVDGGFGLGSFAMTLASTGAMTTVNTGGSSNYCAISGEWGVSAGQFTARGPDCTNTNVTFRAPASDTRLAGTWSASSGNGGSFVLTKQ